MILKICVLLIRKPERAGKSFGQFAFRSADPLQYFYNIKCLQIFYQPVCLFIVYLQ